MKSARDEDETRFLLDGESGSGHAAWAARGRCLEPVRSRLEVRLMLIENRLCVRSARAPNSILHTNERGLNVSWLVRRRVLATVVVEVHFIASEYAVSIARGESESSLNYDLTSSLFDKTYSSLLGPRATRRSPSRNVVSRNTRSPNRFCRPSITAVGSRP